MEKPRTVSNRRAFLRDKGVFCRLAESQLERAGNGRCNNAILRVSLPDESISSRGDLVDCYRAETSSKDQRGAFRI